MSPIITAGASYLNPEDVTDGDIAVILDEGVERESSRYKKEDGTPKKELVFQIEHKDEKKSYTMNFTSQCDCAPVWGNDTAKWKGKALELSVVKQRVGKDMRNVVYSKPSANEGWSE
jgi:hypothetical protein